MNNLLDAELLLELQERFGDVFAQGLIDYLTRYPCRNDDPECLEVLQMSEVAHRLRDHARDMIRECRELEAQAYLHHCELFSLEREIAMRREHIIKRDKDGRAIGGFYVLYKSAWGDFLGFFDAYMKKLDKEPKERTAFKDRAVTRGRLKAAQARAERTSRHTPVRLESAA